MSGAVSLLGGDAPPAAPTAISFSQIAANARVPLFHVEFDPSQTAQNQDTPRSLIIGVPTVSQASAISYVPSLAAAGSAYGRSSPLYASIAAYLASDPEAELYALPVIPSGSPAAATGSITFSGTATAAGTLGVYIGGLSFQVSITSGMTAAQAATATAAAAAASANASYFPVTFTPSSGSVNLTATAAGTQGNAIDVRLNYRGAAAGESLAAGLSASITPMSGGTLVPSFSTLSTTLGNGNWDFLFNPFSDSTSTTAITGVMSNASGRWSDTSQAYGHVWNMHADTAANLITFGDALNDPHQTFFGLYNSPSPPWVIGADAMGAAAQALRADSARTVQTLTLSSSLAPVEGDRFTPANRQALLNNGVATLLPHRDGSLSIERAVTSYQTNSFGAPDQSYLDTETLYNLMFVTRDLKAFVTQTFPRCKLADDGTRAGAGSSVVTPKAIKAALVTRYGRLESLGMVQNTKAFAAGLVVMRNLVDPNRVDVLYDPILMGNLRIFAALNQFRLTA